MNQSTPTPPAAAVSAGKTGQALDVVLVIANYGAGGVERMLVNTSRALVEQGLRVALVLARADGAYLDELPSSPALERIVLDHDLKTGLTDLLARRRPSVAISGKLDDDRLLAAARERAGVSTRIFFRVGNPLGQRLRARGINPFTRWRRLRALRALYQRADGFIAVSHGIKADLCHWLRVAEADVHVLANPVITPEFHQRASADPDHPWLQPGEAPVILGVGGLRKQKDFTTLLRAFAQVRRQRDCRLLILGEGRQRRRLQTRARRLGVASAVDLAGWRADSHACMARAAVFALSSRWEGTANVLIEAAALGRPIVATDCRYGPREVLADGRYGRLTPPGDVDALAAGIRQLLDQPPAPEQVMQAAQPYRMAAAGRRYVEALGLTPTLAPTDG